MEVKLYKNIKTRIAYVEFYDVLENLVKKSIYKASTINKIFHNRSREELITGLDAMCDEKWQLVPELQPALAKIEEIRYYYTQKKSRRQVRGFVENQKIAMPALIVSILRIARFLLKRVKRRKRETRSIEKSLPEEGRPGAIDFIAGEESEDIQRRSNLLHSEDRTQVIKTISHSQNNPTKAEIKKKMKRVKSQYVKKGTRAESENSGFE